MRKVLILNRYRLAAAAFHRWIGANAELYLINDASRSYKTSPDRAEIKAGYAQIVELIDYLDGPGLMRVAREWIATYGIDTIIALSEYDVLRAAELREQFGIVGQDLASANAFRDKLTMKRLLWQSGVPGTAFAELGSQHGLDELVREFGYPLVVKPRTGADSEGVEVVHNEHELRAVVERVLDASSHLVEQHVEHDLLHADGVYVDGRVRFFEAWQWSETLLTAHQAEGTPTAAAILDDWDPRRPELLRLTEQVMRALPSPPVTAFHIEFFDTAQGLLVNEAASRIGGARIQPALRRVRGVDLAEITARYSIEPSAILDLAERRAASGGFVLAYGEPDERLTAPPSCPLEGVADYETAMTLHDGGTMSVALPGLLVSATAVGSSREAVLMRLKAFHDWFLDSCTAHPSGSGQLLQREIKN